MKYSYKCVLIIFLVLTVHGFGQEFDRNDPPGIGDGGLEPLEFERVAQSGWQFLKLPTNARQIGMGGIVTAIQYRYGNALFSNPSKIAECSEENYLFAVNQVNWIADINYQTMAIAKYVKPLGGFVGVSFNYLDYGTMVEAHYVRDDVQKDIAYVGELGTFSAYDMAFGITYARMVTDRLAFGGTVRYIKSRIDEYSMDNWIVDMGSSYQTGLKSLRLCLLARNFGPDSRFINYQEKIKRSPTNIKTPTMMAVGISYDILDNEESGHLLTTAVEGVHFNDSSEKVNVGLEYKLMQILTLRSGYRFNYDEESFTFGAGINVSILDTRLLFDYGYGDFGNLNNIQSFSCSIQF